jgi:hypothetical protein
LALLFVALRGSNSACYFMAKSELPDMALIAVTSVVGAIVALAFSLLFEDANWTALWAPRSLSWTLAAGTISVFSVFAALRSYDYIPQWLTQAFIGLEPFFGTVGIFIVASIVTDEETRQGLLARLPASRVLFVGGLALAVAGVVLMALSKANTYKAT